MTFLGDLLTALARSFFTPSGALGRCLLLYEKGRCGRTSDRGSHQLSPRPDYRVHVFLAAETVCANLYVASLVGVAMVSELGPS